jgi:hypothetical protein
VLRKIIDVNNYGYAVARACLGNKDISVLHFQI